MSDDLLASSFHRSDGRMVKVPDGQAHQAVRGVMEKRLSVGSGGLRWRGKTEALTLSGPAIVMAVAAGRISNATIPCVVDFSFR